MLLLKYPANPKVQWINLDCIHEQYILISFFNNYGLHVLAIILKHIINFINMIWHTNICNIWYVIMTNLILTW